MRIFWTAKQEVLYYFAVVTARWTSSGIHPLDPVEIHVRPVAGRLN